VLEHQCAQSMADPPRLDHRERNRACRRRRVARVMNQGSAKAPTTVDSGPKVEGHEQLVKRATTHSCEKAKCFVCKRFIVWFVAGPRWNRRPRHHQNRREPL
jgi:hypothetical protein